MTKLFTGLFTTICLVVSCSSTNGGTKPIDYRETPVPEGTSSCGKAEKHLQDLCDADKAKNWYCCDTVAPTKRGKDFQEFCKETQDNGVALNPKCLVTITNCGQIDVCVGTTKESK